jgi:Ca2+-binding EF-hand superfamily protein
MRCKIVACIIIFVSGVSSFAEPPAAPKPVAQDEQELVFLQSSRPYRLRLHLQIQGESFQTQWARIVEAMFQYLDADGNGVLSAAELEHAPSPEQLRGLVQGSTELEAAPPPAMVEVTDNPKAGVTLEQLKSYYRRAGIAPWQAEWATRGGQPPSHLDAAILKQWNLGDGDKWPKRIIQNAVNSLFELDKDGDELVTIQELAPNSGLAGFQMQLLPQGKDCPFLLPDNTKMGRKQLAAKLLEKYDRKKRGKLGWEDIGFPKELFEALDRNHDKALDAEELAAWLDQPPDLDLLVRLDSPENEGVHVLPGLNGKPFALAGRAKLSRVGSVLVQLPEEQLEVLRVAGSPAERQQGVPLAPLQGFNDDYVIDSKQIFQPPFTMVAYFRLADRNGDNKLTGKEIRAFIELQKKLVTRSTVLTIVDRGQTLFEFIDADHDRRLSRRELMTLWDRLSPWTKPAADYFDPKDLPQQFQIILSHGELRSPEGDPGSGSVIRAANRLRGPLWFRKMDRNADGDVSRQEFLGTPEQFKLIDKDGDGLIDLQEAEQAGEILKPKQGKK